MNHFFKGLAGALSTVGAYLVYLLGGWDAALTVMFVLMGLDYATGLLTAFMGKSPKTQGGGFRSSVAFIGISKKLMMVAIVMLAAALDRLTGDSNICRSAAIGFYAANEGLSIMENAAAPEPRRRRELPILPFAAVFCRIACRFAFFFYAIRSVTGNLMCFRIK